MAKKEKCEVCRWWQEWPFKTEQYLLKCPHNKDKGDCRKNAPVVAGTSEEGYGCFPDMNKFDWCGEFAERIE